MRLDWKFNLDIISNLFVYIYDYHLKNITFIN